VARHAAFIFQSAYAKQDSIIGHWNFMIDLAWKNVGRIKMSGFFLLSCKSSITWRERGTMCGLRIFILSAGIFQTLFSKSN
jgi:hypothetical protein